MDKLYPQLGKRNAGVSADTSCNGERDFRQFIRHPPGAGGAATPRGDPARPGRIYSAAVRAIGLFGCVVQLA